MKKLFLSMITVSILINMFSIPANAWTPEGNGWINGNLGWSYMVDGYYADGWQYINGNWYYFYKDTNFMAHDTIIDGYYINSDGIWTENIPNGIIQIMNKDINYLEYAMKGINWSFYKQEKINFKDLCSDGWTVPDEYGTVYWIQDDKIDWIGYFVTDGDEVYCLGNQGGMDIYKIENGQVVKRIPYNLCLSYVWRN